ncbi:disulfide bond corrector protein DsbC [Mucilaginibacter gracilis]|uniref:Disulfide bond corrector protein DsbC n=1 Tax=Mucilaginibacter gracilis TaxID=423350 RepID=A0A495J2W9_9SPHI|nr:protein-disulfide reductase DsbD domain-containing protein [Mucilaginibacter gracilis]RKR83326.1 disulfide bond corrector protein DsbC [Mucilaginibacter gracilis]
MKTTLIITSFVFFVQSIFGQILTPVKWSYAAKKTGKNTAVIFIKATIDKGWHIYSTRQEDGGPLKTTISFTQTPNYCIIGDLIEPKPLKKYEKSFEINVIFFEKSVIFQQKIKIFKQRFILKGKSNFMVCNDEKCLPPNDVEFSIPIK